MTGMVEQRAIYG